MQKKIIITFFLSVFLLLPILANAFEKGDQAPDFTQTSLEGQKMSLSDYQGRIVILKLATTWCPTCKQLSGILEDLGPYLKEKDAVFLDVYVQDSEKMIRKSIADRDYVMEYHPILDDGEAYTKYSVYLIPRLLIIDQDMKVAFDSAGEVLSKQQIKKKVAQLSAQEKSPKSSKEP